MCLTRNTTDEWTVSSLYVSVLRRPRPRHQPRLLQAVEQPGHVGELGDHPAADLLAGERLGRPPEDPQDVVLRGGDPAGLEQPGELRLVAVAGARQVQRHLLL